LWYQMAITGRRDLTLAPGMRVGFEMCLLRMLAFVPFDGAAMTPEVTAAKPVVKAKPAAAPSVRPHNTAAAAEPAARVETSKPPAETVALPDTADAWLKCMQRLNLKGPLGQVAAHSALVSRNGPNLVLSYPPDLYDSLSETVQNWFEQALTDAFGAAVKVKFEKLRDAVVETLFDRESQQRQDRQSQAEAEFSNHPVVSALLSEGGQIVPESVRPLELK